MKKALLIACLALAAVAAGLYLYWSFGNNHVLRFPGIVEIQEVRLGSKIGGRVARVLVLEGQELSRGQELVVIEAPELENQREQLKARVLQAEAELERIVYGPRVEEKRAAQAAADAAKARYDKMVAGWREEEKRQAKSELETAEADLKQTIDDLARVGDLYRTRSIARAEYEAALAARDRARGRANAARARHDMFLAGNRKEDKAEAKAAWQQAQAKSDELHNGSRPEDIALAKAKLFEIKAKLHEVEINLKEAVVVVPDAPQFDKAIMEVVAVRPGDIVAAGQSVVRVLCADDLWVKIFVPETQLGLVTLNQEVDVRIDSHPHTVFKGKVFHRASISEFTPRNVQSVDERRHQVFGVKIRVDDPQGVVNAGMAADVRIR
ncbi:MAG: efflux RND transporter periplasmic adaptor subunit [Gemmataceae bacterium]|nr:efflux RND transporter periplasmic adaptor subunit [Gemmataceae bacterium]